MIVIKIELHSARTKEITLLGSMVIANDGTSKDHKRGNYLVGVANKKDAADLKLAMSRPLRTGVVKDFPRLSYNVWRLVLRALKSAFPEEN